MLRKLLHTLALLLFVSTAAADSGYLRSMSVLAKSYEEGILTEKSPEKAIEWYKRAAQKEEPLAMYKVARIYEHKDSVEGKKKKALRESETIKLYTRAATLRNTQAQMKLAEFYGNGRYVKKDKKKRRIWKSAKDFLIQDIIIQEIKSYSELPKHIYYKSS